MSSDMTGHAVGAWPTAGAMRATQMTLTSSAWPVFLLKIYSFLFEILLFCSKSQK